MPKFICRCSYVMNLSNLYSDYELMLIPEQRIQEIAEKLENEKKMEIDDFYKLIDELKFSVYRCPSCDRLYIENDAGLFESFIKE